MIMRLTVFQVDKHIVYFFSRWRGGEKRGGGRAKGRGVMIMKLQVFQVHKYILYFFPIWKEVEEGEGEEREGVGERGRGS